MAEQLSHPSEKHERKISSEHHEEAPRKHERENSHERHEHEKHLDKQELSKQVKQEAKSRHEVHIGGHEQESQKPQWGVQKEFKLQAYHHTLKKIRSHLTPAERAFSKVIHQPVIEAISEISSKTLARPSAVLGGGITALVGSGTILYMSKHYGFEYNFFVYVLFMIVGFGLGIVLELLLGGVRHKS